VESGPKGISLPGKGDTIMLLEVRGLSKSFKGLKALSDVTFSLEEKEIVGLIGPNGAGKTTLFNTLAGTYAPDKGEVVFDGRNISNITPDKACKLGIGRTFQITKPFLRLTVLQAITIGSLNRAGGVKKAVRMAEEIIESVGLSRYRNNLGETLNVAQRKRLELARALATQPRLLLLDEVVAGLTPSEVNNMIDLIKQVATGGLAIMIVEHILKVVLSVSRRVIVLHHGELIADKASADVLNDHRVVEVYLGAGRRHA
jgi:branched-chain amino acid transport system ATP-binding protein